MSEVGEPVVEYCEHGRLLMVWCTECWDWAEWIAQSHNGNADGRKDG